MCAHQPMFFTRTLILFFAFVFVGAQAETFKNPGLIQTTYDPLTVATGDLNGDGIPDLVYVDGISPYGLHILLGNGDGTFADKTDLILPADLGPIINLADVTNDGVLDIIVGGATSSSGEIAVFPGKGDGTFAAAVITKLSHSGSNGGSASFNANLAFADVNGDGAVDLVAADYMSATIYILFGNNTGKFTLGSTVSPYYFTGETKTYLYDLNGDGNLDMVVNDLAGGETYVFLGNGNSTFQSGIYYAARAVLLTDLNGDGHPDLVGTAAPGQIQVLLGNPDGTFASPTIVTDFPAADVLGGVGDFNGDGLPDFLLITPVGVAVALGQGNLSFASPTASVAGALLPGYYLNCIAIAKFIGNNDSDVAMAVDGGLLLLKSNGDGTFASADSYDLSTTVGAVSVGDYNGDKLPDIAVTVSATYPRVLLGNGTGQFSPAPDQNKTYSTAAPSQSMLTADFNGDGKSDLDILADSSSFPYGQPFILYGEGEALFAPPVAINTGPSLIGDFNNDGRSDLIYLSGAGIVVMLGQSSDSFSQVITPVNYPTLSVAGIGDLNQDGKLDAVTFESGLMRVWLGKGDGTFTQANLLNISTQQLNTKSVIVADVDGDGNADIVVIPYPNQIGPPYPFAICYGNGDGTFQAPVLLSISHTYTQLVVADVNQDHKPDLVMTDGSVIAVIEGQGNRTFGAEQHFVAGQQISGLTVSDVNGDGFPDIEAANYNGTTAVVLLNEPTSNSLEGAQSSGSLTVSPNPVQSSQPVTLGMTLSVSSGPTPTGSVSFGIDGTFIGTALLANGKVNYTYSGALITGSHTVTATYNGDQTYASENFTALLTVQPPVYSTSTVLTASPTTVSTSQTVRITVTVTANSAAVPAGDVTFFDGTATLGVQQIYGNTPLELDTNLLSAETHSLTAFYHGWQDPFDEQAIYQPSTSSPVQVVVIATATTTLLTPSTTSATAGTVITFTANVSSNKTTPFGGATFYDGTIPLGTSSLQADGSCEFSTASLATGTHTITATFNANATFAASTSASSVITINAPASSLIPTAVAVVTGPAGNQLVLKALVATPTSGVAGKVNFLDGGAILGTAITDASGNASLTVPALVPGVHNLFANFIGDSQFAPSASPVLVEKIPSLGVGFALSVSAHSLDLTKLEQSLQLSVTPAGAFQETTHLSCPAGLPQGYTCVFSPATLSNGNSELQIQGPSSNSSPLRACAFSAGIVGLLSFVLLGTIRKKRGPFISTAAAILVFCMSGCGNPPRALHGEMTVLSIRAMAGTGTNSVVHSAQVVLLVDSH